jgi:TonB-dependent receptor-like protein
LIRAVLFAALALAAAAPSVAAQADTTQRDTTAGRQVGDSAPPPPDTTEMLLPTFAPVIAPGPLPHGARYTFTDDSLLLLSSQSLSDLLTHIPGVYVVRGGWYGQAEVALYGGRGPASLEIFVDGIPYLPLGRDSIYVDPARISLAAYERVDVLVMPGALQIYLVSLSYRSTNPRTQIGVMTGRQNIAGYRAGYSKRARSGFGVSLIADWNSMGPGPLSNTTTSFGTSDFLLKAEYVPPGGRVGASFTVFTSSWKRSAATDNRVVGWRQDRLDRVLRFFIAQRGDGLGWRLTTTLTSSGLSHDTLVGNRDVSSGTLEASLIGRRATLVGIARGGAGGMPSQFEARAGWMASVVPLTVAGWFRQSLYADGRQGVRAYGTAGLRLPLGFTARAEATWQKDVQSALVTSDDLQEPLDMAGWLGYDRSWLSFEVGRGRRDPFAPLGFEGGIITIDSLNPSPFTEFVAARGSVKIVSGLRVSGWYFNPLVGGADFEPPHHARLSATFQSKFWRVYKSGIFRLRGEVAMESWSRWAFGGLDSGGVVVRSMTGSSFVDANIQMQLAGVTLFWTMRNANLMRASYVEGLGYPKAVQSWGARWYFTN